MKVKQKPDLDLALNQKTCPEQVFFLRTTRGQIMQNLANTL